MNPEWSGSLKIFFFACLFLSRCFLYRETLSNFINCYKFGIL